MTKTDDCVCSIIDIAPTISELIDVPLPGANGVVIPEMIDCLQGCDRLILIIVDSLGYSTYQRLNSAMPHVSGNGTVLRSHRFLQDAVLRRTAYSQTTMSAPRRSSRYSSV